MVKKKKITLPPTDWRGLAALQKKNAKTTFFILSGCSLVFLLIVILDFCQTRQWDKKASSYDHVQGILLKHDRVTRRSGRNRRTVSEIEYSFKYKGVQYTGNKIAYGEKDYPYRKSGKVINIIVNPSQPEDSAAMIYYGSNMSKYASSISLGIFWAILLIIAVTFLLTSKTALPQKFIDYCESVPPEKREELRSKPLSFCGIAKYTLNGSIKYKYHTYAIITSGVGKIADFIFFIILITNITGAIITQQVLILIPAAVLFFIILISRPVKVIFNLAEKTFTYKKFLTPAPTENTHSFDDISFLCITPKHHSKGGLHFALYIVKNDNEAIYITQVQPAQLAKLCNVAVELAELLGNVPLIVK
ncbi:MAG: DUF3592 domain-containing protein [Lentisphaeria bacterium]|nr:DUF3592 domain-containing protein [Lentisphaeria bacterium]